MTLHPAASAAESLRAGVIAGKFHGVNAATGPIACFFHELLHARAVGWHHAAVDTASLFGEPFEIVGGTQDFVAAFCQWFAFLERHDGRDVLGALAHQFRRTLQNARAFGRHGVAPEVKSRCGGLQGAIQIGCRRQRDAPDLDLRGGVDHRRRFAFARTDPFAVDEKMKRVVTDVHGISLYG